MTELRQVSILVKSSIASLVVALVAMVSLRHSALANSFDVYCTANGDQTLTCTGWEGDQDLTCVANVGRSLSCQASSGQTFVCVNNLGTTSCTDPYSTGAQTTQCTFDGGGTSSCAQPDEQSAPLIEAPSITEPSIEIPDNLMNPRLSLPSVF